MRAWVVAGCCLAAACGGPKEHFGRSDAGPDSFPGCPSATEEPCNVLTQTGCASGERCTWIYDAPQLGIVACEPAGPVPEGGACAFTPFEPHACSFDNCTRGTACWDGVCRRICDQGGMTPSCDPDYACKTHDGLFGPSGMEVAAGVCEPRCDPFADNDFLGSGYRSGSACSSSAGCYAVPGFAAPTAWTCELDSHPNLVHRSAVGNTDPREANLCGQGYLPIFADAEGSTQVDCIAICAPLDCYAGNCGSNSANLGGAEPHACNSSDARGIFNVATGSNNGDQCMYSWVFEIDGTTGVHQPSPTSNTVGFCIDHSRYSFPSCDTLPLGSGSQDAPSYGCVSTQTAGIPRRAIDLRLPLSAVRNR